MSCSNNNCDNDHCCHPEVVIQQTPQQITVVVDSTNPNITPLSQLLNNLANSYQYFSQSTTVINSYSGKFIETAEEMDQYIQPLTGKWIETGSEMDTLQIGPTANWQGVYEYIEAGVVDAGFF